ncbi:MAG: hypothetical protein WBM28_13165 [Burkholderiales bacterium]
MRTITRERAGKSNTEKVKQEDPARVGGASGDFDQANAFFDAADLPAVSLPRLTVPYNSRHHE